MSSLQALTATQRRIVIALALSVVAVTGLLAWSVWSTLQQPPAPSPLATPTSAPPTATRTATLAPTRAPTHTPSPTPLVAFDISRAGIIASEVADARQATGRWETSLTLVDDTGMARALYAHYEASPPLVLHARPALTALRLWFWDVLRQDLVTQSTRVASFYSAQLEELYLRRDWAGKPEALELQLAYGYARALPEQAGNLKALREAALVGRTATLDRGLALSAVAEGDAFIAVLLHQGITPGSAEAELVETEIARAVCPVWRVDDPLLDDLSCLAFRLGTDFATTLYSEAGIGALDTAVLRPPWSTEQIIHPESYIPTTPAGDGGTTTEPRLLTTLEPALGRGWVVSTTDTLGEVLMGMVLREWNNELFGPEAGAGWDGDLLQMWQAPDGTQVTVWQTAWDEPRLAGQFYGDLLDVIPDFLVPGPIATTLPPAGVPGGRWWSGDQGAAFLYRRGDQVSLIWSTDAAAVEAVAAALR